MLVKGLGGGPVAERFAGSTVEGCGDGVQVGISPSVGSVGDSYDNALAESVIGLLTDVSYSIRQSVSSRSRTRRPRSSRSKSW